ncbi:MAG: ribonuclease HII [Acidobacteria bacterium]|nr:MAG: ribonuclease HII [Acidobacteriota bacterium]
MAEGYRLQLMRGLEERLENGGFGRVAGVDEAGRGALAGPVIAAAVVVERGALVPGVDDSKNLDAGRRERLARAISAAHPQTAVAAAPPAEVDRLNVLEATRRAMRRALAALAPPPDVALVDAVSLAGLPFPVLPVIRGDRISYAIACASILAKVERDRIMRRLDARHPQYGFARHKGYGAAAHRRALERYGPSPVHRLTFRSVLPRPAAQAAGGRR